MAACEFIDAALRGTCAIGVIKTEPWRACSRCENGVKFNSYADGINRHADGHVGHDTDGSILDASREVTLKDGTSCHIRIMGSGFFLDAATGLLLTAEHVRRGCREKCNTHASEGAKLVVCPYLGDELEWDHAWEAKVVAHTGNWNPKDKRDLPEPGLAAEMVLTALVDAAMLRPTRELMTGTLVSAPVCIPRTGSPVATPSTGEAITALRISTAPLKTLQALLALGFPTKGGKRTPTPIQGNYSHVETDPVQATGTFFKFTGAEILNAHSGGPIVTNSGVCVAWSVRNSTDLPMGGVNHVRPIEAAKACIELALPLFFSWADLLATKAEESAHAMHLRGDASAAGATAGAVSGAAAATQAVAGCIKAGTEAGTEAGATAGATAGTKAGTDAGTIAGTMAGTTAGTMAGTEAGQVGALQVQVQMGLVAQKMLASRGFAMDIEDQQAGSMPLLRSPPSDTASTASPPPSPARSNTEMWLVIDGDFPEFDADGFKNKLAGLLRHEVEPTKINIEDDEGDEGQVVARVSTGSCKVTVRYNLYSGGMFTTDDEPALKDQLKNTLKGLVQRFWPSDVDVESIKIKLEVRGSIILLIELPQPLPVLLMQLAEQRSAALLEAVPGLLFCQLGRREERLAGCEDEHVHPRRRAIASLSSIPIDVLQALKDLDLESKALQNAALWCVKNEPSCLTDIQEEPELSEFLEALSLPEDPENKLVGAHAAKYQSIKLIGTGSFGKTYLVRNRRSDQQFASKQMSKPTKMEADEALKEFDVMQRFRHQMLVEALESFCEPTAKGEFTVRIAFERVAPSSSP